MSKLYVIFVALLCFVVAQTAPLAVFFALLCTKRDAKNLAWSWYDTPDEAEFIGLYEPTVQRIYNKYGWFISAWYWFGLRNRAHGFDSLFSKEAPSYWPEGGPHKRDGFFYTRKISKPYSLGKISWCFHTSFGWPVYSSSKYPSKLEYRPQLAIKTRHVI